MPSSRVPKRHRPLSFRSGLCGEEGCFVNNRQDQAGFSLIEMLASIVVMAIVTVSIVSVLRIGRLLLESGIAELAVVRAEERLVQVLRQDLSRAPLDCDSSAAGLTLNYDDGTVIRYFYRDSVMERSVGGRKPEKIRLPGVEALEFQISPSYRADRQILVFSLRYAPEFAERKKETWFLYRTNPR